MIDTLMYQKNVDNRFYNEFEDTFIQVEAKRFFFVMIAKFSIRKKNFGPHPSTVHLYLMVKNGVNVNLKVWMKMSVFMVLNEFFYVISNKKILLKMEYNLATLNL